MPKGWAKPRKSDGDLQMNSAIIWDMNPENQDNAHWMIPDHISKSIPIARAHLFVLYYGRLVAVIDENGRIGWRDFNYPMFLIEYLVGEKDHRERWN